ncbi:MAG: glycoside hydrolase family 88 protein [Bryobacterales bacterium]|nr:glycoside hydrolase family 88 protein [Bryobacterales bacterium]MDE0296289.1 glycoside hydrolase family 88 protein [Bryobacterales bacterium]
MLPRWMTLGVVLVVLGAAALAAQTPAEKVERLLSGSRLPGVIQTSIGVTRKGTPIPALITNDDLDYFTPKTRVLLVGGLDGSESSVQATLSVLRWFYLDANAQAHRERVALSAVPLANPDGWASGIGPSNGSGGNPTVAYPPQGTAYNSATDPEAAYLWRWIAMHAPELVVDLRVGTEWAFAVRQIGSETDARGIAFNLSKRFSPDQDATIEPADDELVNRIARQAAGGVGAMAALRVRMDPDDRDSLAPELFKAVQRAGMAGWPGSTARESIQRRLRRSPVEVAQQLAAHYGHELERVAYIPALALLGRIRLADLSGDESHLADVERIVKPYLDGVKATLPDRPSGSNLSGHLVFAELARVTKKTRYIELARAAADLGFDNQGTPGESMPFHNEMSDSVFMGTPILAEVGRLTGEAKYFDMALRHMKFMQDLCLRPDGLYRHSPLDEAAWGRGNGFPALGLALSLSAMPEDHPGRSRMLAAFRNHLEALLRRQDPSGMWHQVIDHPESYRELTATSMITFAMVRGLRSGWLDRKRYEPVINRAWESLKARIAPSGDLVDVCTGTGKQKSLRDYFDRTAILGHDDRGGAMALMISTEMAYWQRER